VIVGLDARPALYGRTGFGRVTRQLLLALAARRDLELRACGLSWRRPTEDTALPGLVRRRLPARLQQAAASFGYGVESCLGPPISFSPFRIVPFREFSSATNNSPSSTKNVVFFRDSPASSSTIPIRPGSWRRTSERNLEMRTDMMY